MRRRVFTVLFALLFLVGFGVLAYPTISNQWNTYRQSRLISKYKEVTEETGKEDFTREWEKARAYNDSNMANQPMSADVFSTGGQEDEDSEYWNVLNLNGDGMMGYISIPKINVELAIYHGLRMRSCRPGSATSRGTKLPVGGEGNHTVLAAHRGLPSAKLFTDLDQLVEGDEFYIHIFDEGACLPGGSDSADGR